MLWAAKHIEHFHRTGQQFLFVVFPFALAWLRNRSDILHPIYTVMEERPFLLIGIEVVLDAAPQNSYMTNCDRLSLIAVLLLLVPCVVVKTETYLPIAGDTVIELVALPHHTFIHAADTLCDKCLPV